ncbi:uncharacterized protein B0T15DRAFT_489729 [Chaetomium strumarium]|uniref:Uncharacterized protein n=1 Tax=Chaetomium strumarium TaxID=1170767 RepID=A0AAJ0H3K7_9PEZI|nr:hypothetical protein B0T15DRAFT_489729 [Chaetomium strumarium]
MKSSIQVFLFFLLGLVAGLAIPGTPRRQSQTQFAVVDFLGKEACHSILTSCRVDSDCCSGLKCGTFDDESLCVPGG